MGSLFYGYQLSVLNLSQKKLDYVYGLEENLELYHGIEKLFCYLIDYSKIFHN